MSADLIARLQVCAKFDPDQAEAIKVIQSQAAEIAHLREERRELQTRADRLLDSRMDTLRELRLAKWDTRYWRVIAIAHHVVLIGAVYAALAAWR